MTRHMPLDLARGSGILLVVIGHAWRGLDRASLIESNALFSVIDRLIYNFHMPLFFVLAGMTFQDWVLRRPLGEALISRVTRLIWPLVLWTYVFATMRLAAGGNANDQISGWQSLIFFPLPPRDHFWFLWALFLLQIAGIFGIRAYGRKLPQPVWLALAVGAALIAAYVPFVLNQWTVGAMIHASAFLTGIWLGPKLPLLGMTGLAATALGFALLQWASFHLPSSLILTQALGIALSVAMLALCAALASHRGAITRVLAHLGQASMAIFLAHTIFSAATRSALAPITSGLVPHMVLGTIAGLIGPLLILAAIRRVAKPSWIGF